MMTTKLKILGATALACIFTIGGFHAMGRQAGEPALPDKRPGPNQNPTTLMPRWSAP